MNMNTWNRTPVMKEDDVLERKFIHVIVYTLHALNIQMVGEREMSIIRPKTSPANEGQNCSYSRCKMEKKAQIQTDDDNGNNNDNEIVEHQQLIENFVQEIMKRAKSEYLRQCPNLNDDHGIKARDTTVRLIHKDADGDKGTFTNARKMHKSNKNRSNWSKRQPKYKYSDPVDEKEISKYECQQQKTDLSLEWDQNFVKHTERRESLQGFYHRVGGALRHLCTCCIGKT